MSNIFIPDGYKSDLDLRETQIAIKEVKDFFQLILSTELNLHRVTAPLFVAPESGLNDNLNGVERPVSFGVREQGDRNLEVVHSLAKWKRMALGKYGFRVGEGLYTDMNAIRRDEDTDNVHSIYVDQWDWEKIITRETRNKKTFEDAVKSIYEAVRLTEKRMSNLYDYIDCRLPEEIFFITTEELFRMYPDMTAHEREDMIARQHGAVCIEKIGGKLSSGEPHDGRAPDYDDWELNGDILVYYPLLSRALELSSMGIRVDADSLKKQLSEAGCPERAELPFQKAIIEDRLPLTIGGGIGQSRLCMFLLRKAHIGEVQVSVWPDETIRFAESRGVSIL
jgi:aspartate--ammonia ligase